MKTAIDFLAEKKLSGYNLSRHGVIRLMEEYAKQFDRGFSLQDIKEAFRQGTNCEIKNKDYDRSLFACIVSLQENSEVKVETLACEHPMSARTLSKAKGIHCSICGKKFL